MAYVLDRNPCGSSSGTGVAVSADLATVGVGTETDGSIVCPAGENGLVGIKPTIGFWSRSGIVPISADQDTAGPMARNVTDAAVLLGAGVGIDPTDAATAAQSGHAFTDYTQFLDADSLDGARIGVWHSYDDAGDAATIAIFKDTVDELESLGATVVDPLEIDFGTGFAREFDALLCEFKTDIASYLGTYTGAGYPKTLQDLIDFDIGASGARGRLERRHLRPGAGDRRPGRSRLRRRPRRDDTGDPGGDRCTRSPRTTSTPSSPRRTIPAWVTDPVNGDTFEGFIASSSAAAVSGYASITVANGFVGPLPVDVSFIGGRWSEPTLIAFAYAFEQATHVRVPPTFLRRRTSMPSARQRKPADHGERHTPVPGHGRSLAPVR